MAQVMRVLRAATVALVSACGADKLPPLSLVQSFNVTPSGAVDTLALGKVVFNFPPNAVSQSVEVTATAATGPSSPTVDTGTVYSFQPSMTFNVPVTVTVKYQGTTLPQGVRANELGLYKVVGNVWKLDSASVVDTVAKTVRASLTGFSIHGILGAPVATVAVSPTARTIHVADTLTLTAVARDDSSNVLPGRGVSWHSSSTATATVTSAGLVTGVAVGTDTVTATVTAEGVSGFAIVTVTAVPVASVTVSPTADTIAVQGTAQLTATVRDSAGNTLSGRVITWASSDTTKAKVSSTGLVTGIAAGAATVTATSGGKSGSSVITVTAAPLPVASVTVSPAVDTIAALATVQLTATLKDSLGHTLSGRVIAWASSDTTKAKVSPTGLVTGVAAGSCTVTATSETKSGGAAIVVTAASGVNPVFQDNFDTGTLAAAQNGYGWDPVGSRVTVSSGQKHSGTYSLEFDAGPDPLGEFVPVSGTGANGSFTRSSGTWTANEWTTNANALVWPVLANGQLVAGAPFTVTSNDATTLHFTGDATNAVSVSGEAAYGNQGSLDGSFHFGAYVTEVWIEFWWYVPSNYAQRLHNNFNAASANNKLLLVWNDTYSGATDWEPGWEFYPNYTNGAGAQVTGTGTSWLWPTVNSTVNGSIITVPTPYTVNLAASAGDVYIGTGGYVVPGQWNQMRYHFKASSAYGNTDGVMEHWVNGTLVFQKTNGSFYGAATPFYRTLHHGYLIGSANSGYTQETKFYIDDFKIYDQNPAW